MLQVEQALTHEASHALIFFFILGGCCYLFCLIQIDSQLAGQDFERLHHGPYLATDLVNLNHVLTLLPHDHFFELSILSSQSLHFAVNGLLISKRCLQLWRIFFKSFHFALHICNTESLVLYNFTKLLRQIWIAVINAHRAWTACITASSMRARCLPAILTTVSIFMYKRCHLLPDTRILLFLGLASRNLLLEKAAS